MVRTGLRKSNPRVALVNDKINPEDRILVLLPVENIPDGATVTKRTGDKEYVLRRNMKVYLLPDAPDRTIEIEGFFLGADGEVRQVQEGTLLHWNICAEDFVDEMQRSWHERVEQ